LRWPELTPCPVFRDQLYKHLETVPAGDFDAYTNKLVVAGGTLEYLKYADALFEILILGGLLQPGGSFVEDGVPTSPFSIANVPEPVQIDEVKKYVEVFNKLIRRCVILFVLECARKLTENPGTSTSSVHSKSRRFPP
jgi:hypothetical protein